MLKPLIIIEGYKKYQFDRFDEITSYLFGDNYNNLSKEEKFNIQKKNAFAKANDTNLKITSIQEIKNPQNSIESSDKFILFNEMTYILSLLKTGRITLLENVISNIFTNGLDKSNIKDNYIIINSFADELLDKYINVNPIEKGKQNPNNNSKESKDDRYKKAYKEISEIIKHMPEEEQNKIPEKLKDLMKKKMDNNHKFSISDYESIEEAPLLDETKAIMAVLYRDFLADEKEKIEYKQAKLQELKEIQAKKSNINYEIPKETYNIYNTPVKPEIKEGYNSFNSQVNTQKQPVQFNTSQTQNISNETALTKIEENKWYKKFINFFKEKFKRKNKEISKQDRENR